MARWPLQPVVNVGLQILLAIGLGWALVAARVLDAERYMPQVNTLVLWVGITSLNGYYLGVKLQLFDAEAWRSLAAYVLWICLTQLGILIYCLVRARLRAGRGAASCSHRGHRRRQQALDKQEAGAKQQQKQQRSGAGFVQNGHSYSHVQDHLQKVAGNGSSNGGCSVSSGSAGGGGGTHSVCNSSQGGRPGGDSTDGGGGDNSGGGSSDGGGGLLREAGLLTLLLTANNCGMIGLPIMDATYGSGGRRLALLTGIPVMLWVVPFAIFTFELHTARRSAAAAATATTQAAAADNAGGDGGQQPQQLFGMEQPLPLPDSQPRVSRDAADVTTAATTAAATAAAGSAGPYEGSSSSRGGRLLSAGGSALLRRRRSTSAAAWSSSETPAAAAGAGVAAAAGEGGRTSIEIFSRGPSSGYNGIAVPDHRRTATPRPSRDGADSRRSSISTATAAINTPADLISSPPVTPSFRATAASSAAAAVAASAARNRVSPFAQWAGGGAAATGSGDGSQAAAWGSGADGAADANSDVSRRGSATMIGRTAAERPAAATAAAVEAPADLTMPGQSLLAAASGSDAGRGGDGPQAPPRGTAATAAHVGNSSNNGSGSSTQPAAPPVSNVLAATATAVASPFATLSMLAAVPPGYGSGGGSAPPQAPAARRSGSGGGGVAAAAATPLPPLSTVPSGDDEEAALPPVPEGSSGEFPINIHDTVGGSPESVRGPEPPPQPYDTFDGDAEGPPQPQPPPLPGAAMSAALSLGSGLSLPLPLPRPGGGSVQQATPRGTRGGGSTAAATPRAGPAARMAPAAAQLPRTSSSAAAGPRPSWDRQEGAPLLGSAETAAAAGSSSSAVQVNVGSGGAATALPQTSRARRRQPSSTLATTLVSALSGFATALSGALPGEDSATATAATAGNVADRQRSLPPPSRSAARLGPQPRQPSNGAPPGRATSAGAPLPPPQPSQPQPRSHRAPSRSLHHRLEPQCSIPSRSTSGLSAVDLPILPHRWLLEPATATATPAVNGSSAAVRSYGGGGGGAAGGGPTATDVHHGRGVVARRREGDAAAAALAGPCPPDTGADTDTDPDAGGGGAGDAAAVVNKATATAAATGAGAADDAAPLQSDGGGRNLDGGARLEGGGAGGGVGGGDDGRGGGVAAEGGGATVAAQAQLVTVLRTVGKNPLLWSLLVSLIANLSGLRHFLDPESPAYVEGLGFIAELLHWFAGTAIPVSLVSIGVWMYGKRLPSAVLKRAGLLLCLKVLLLPALQAACGLALGLPTPAVMALTLLALCPTATTTFVIAAHYGHGADVVCAVTVGGTLLLVPVMVGALQLPRALGVDIQLAAAAAAAAPAGAGAEGR